VCLKPVKLQGCCGALQCPAAAGTEEFPEVATEVRWGRKELKAYLDDESSLNASLRKLSKRYSEISIPVVILTGDHDQIVSARENAYRLKTSIGNSQLIELKKLAT
jgi:pimeloyl-ACP methyl ester carboxylesterase